MTLPEKTNPEAANPRGSETALPGGLRKSYAIENSGPRAGFPTRLTSERFPGKKNAIKRAHDRPGIVRAVADFVHAGMFVRHVSGTYTDLTRWAIAYEAWQHVRYSKAPKEIQAAEVAAIAVHMDDLARERCAR